MTLVEELMTVAAALEGACVEYALVGGLAVAVWGAPRATKDIDLLVRPGGSLWVISRDALIGMKAQAARPQDIADIERLNEGDR